MKASLYLSIDILKHEWSGEYDDLILSLEENIIYASTYGEICDNLLVFFKKLKEENNPGYVNYKSLVDTIVQICLDWFHD